ncbi:hypothetical protein BACCIP111899_03541 [Bacillus rhizoplanae]|uniref:Uncharacterized protein n=1 Tax=Bacillus rhizoplanae TaxID=2880966 RepID=A0ABM8YF52_9BACI|nr:hypothetical protein [Bacillus rhizoplanae]CAG9614314.1 hypothetical protein BACCIP111899_03541 [Bacillus rhizoplanae]
MLVGEIAVTAYNNVSSTQGVAASVEEQLAPMEEFGSAAGIPSQMAEDYKC